MPLPTTGMAWPPRALDGTSPKLAEWDAWWTGNPDALTLNYQGAHSTRPSERPGQYRGGVVGAWSRFWWGRPQQDLTQQRQFTHVPIAADIARASADLLFSEPPDVTVGDQTTQKWVEGQMGDMLWDTLTGAAERGAALGGVYLRVTWDPAIRDFAFPTAVPANEAWPEFAWGVLRAVTFWHVVGVEGQTYWRHLERHELSTDGIGLVQHGLYEGTADALGAKVDLQNHSATRPLVGSVDDAGYLLAGRTRGLTVAYVPNTNPLVSKAWTRTPGARGWGASDYDGIEPLMDNLDEIYASWIRDIRLAKGRLIVARYMLEDQGAGRGATFDTDQEVFSPLKMAAAESGDAPITPVQFAIRVTEHQATAQEWSEKIIRNAGYSMQTFGEYAENTQLTATEVNSRDSRSMLTRDRKIRNWTPELTRFIQKLLLTDADVFGRPHKPDDLTIEFPDGVQENGLVVAQTAQALRTAEAASTETLVKMVHPEWTDPDVKAEVQRITDEKSAGAPVDPFAVVSSGSVDPNAYPTTA